MSEASIIQLKQTVESQHGGTATFVQSVPVREKLRGRAAFSGTVAIFDLKNSPSGATRAFAWEQDRPDGSKRYVAILQMDGITGPVDAVRAAIVVDARARNGPK